MDAEGLGCTKKVLLSVPSEVGTVNCADTSKQYEGKIHYANYKTPDSTTVGLVAEDFLAWRKEFQFVNLRRWFDRSYSTTQNGLLRTKGLLEHRQVVKGELQSDQHRPLVVNWGSTNIIRFPCL